MWCGRPRRSAPLVARRATGAGGRLQVGGRLAAGGRMKAKVGSRTGDSRITVKKSKAVKDPNKPKCPPSAFFVFMDTFRKEYKEKHPDVKQISVIKPSPKGSWW